MIITWPLAQLPVSSNGHTLIDAIGGVGDDIIEFIGHTSRSRHVSNTIISECNSKHSCIVYIVCSHMHNIIIIVSSFIPRPTLLVFNAAHWKLGVASHCLQLTFLVYRVLMMWYCPSSLPCFQSWNIQVWFHQPIYNTIQLIMVTWPSKGCGLQWLGQW